MLHTYLEVLQTVLERYEHATALARDEHRHCTYAHDHNGVGCAIGCLFDADTAALLESRAAVNNIGAEITTLYQDAPAKYHVDQALDIKAIDMSNLMHLQRLHDGASEVYSFRQAIRTEIAILTLKERV